MRRIAVFVLLMIGMATRPAVAEFALTDDDVVVFYADTAFGEFHFTKWMDLFIRIKYPDLKAKTINMGRNGNDTVRALDNLDKEVLVYKPTKVALCFGLEDAKRRAFSPKAAASFAANLATLVDRVKAAGAAVILVTPPTPEEHKNAALKNAKYASVMQEYSKIVAQLAKDKGAELVDWNAATAAYMEKHPAKPNRHMTKDGLMPQARGIAILLDMLLERWNAEPIEQKITAHWAGSDQVEVTQGSGSVFQRSGDRLSLALKDVPIPLEMPDTRFIPMNEWPLARWCSYVLQVPDAPQEGGFSLSAAGGVSQPVEAAKLREGVDLAALGVFMKHHPVHDLNIRAITKANQFLQYRESLHRPVPEPELKRGFEMYAAANLEFAYGAYKVFLRTPSRMDARLEITHLGSAAFEEAKAKAAQPPRPKSRFPRRPRKAPKKN